jgi:MoxR-like ATPase
MGATLMGFPFYSGQPEARRPTKGAEVPGSRRVEQVNPEGYLADAGLVDAVNVALLLGQPLLLTGEPGTGKTQLAYSLAWELGLDEPLKFETKSSSTAVDLFYTYNALGHFHAAQVGEGSRRPLDYLTYNALGIAILRAKDESNVRTFLPDGFDHGGRCRSVVLIDEIDKAPRDFPNDLLNEVEAMYFRVPELGNPLIAADPAMHPILVITSNSEKNLPDAFLRRCIFYHIPFPDRERLTRIIDARIGRFVGQDRSFLADALVFFSRLREPTVGLRKKPATAELLSWLVALRTVAPEAKNPLDGSSDAAQRTLSTLVKTAEDQELSQAALKRWQEDRHR